MRGLIARAKTSFFTLVLSIGFAMVATSSVGAVSGDTEIRAVVCGGGGSSVSVSSPQDDSTVNDSTIDVQGSVSHATQITISIDGQYSQTIPLGNNQTSFQASVSIAEGTHTILFVANDVCQVSNGSTSIVLTYEPTTDPSNGGETPTDVDNGGVAVGTGDEAVATDPSLYQKLKDTVVVGSLLDLLEKGFDYVGLDTTAEQGGTIVTAFRVSLFGAGVGMLAFTSLFLERAAMGWIGVFDKYIPENPLKIRGYRLWILRGIGTLSVLISLVI